MREWINLFFQTIGIVTVTSIAVICVRIIIDKCIKAIFCKHKYSIKSRLKAGEKNVLFLKCNKCGKEKNIEIYDDKFIIELKEETEEENNKKR